MINKQASALPRRLIRKFKCNDPFELAEALDIDVMERADFKRQKGAFKVILFRPFAALRGFDDEISSEGASKLLEPCLEFCAAGVSQYRKNWRGSGQTQGAGRHPGRVVYLWNVLPIWLN